VRLERELNPLIQPDRRHPARALRPRRVPSAWAAAIPSAVCRTASILLSSLLRRPA